MTSAAKDAAVWVVPITGAFFQDVLTERGRGAEFDGEPQDIGFGIGIRLRVPAAGALLLYQPKHLTAYDL